MRVRERVHDLTEQFHRLVHWQLALTPQPIPEASALDIGHDVVEEPVGLAGVEQRQGARMLELGGDLDLTGEPLEPQGGRDLGAAGPSRPPCDGV